MQLAHSAKPVIPRDRLLRLGDVELLTGLKKSTLYMLMARGEFPGSTKLSGRVVAWSENAVLQWVQDRVAAATAGAKQAVQQ